MSDHPKDTPPTTPRDTPTTTWEDAPGFREVFLMHWPPEAAQAFRQAGRHLYDSALEQALHEPAEPWVEAQVRALQEDLRFSARVLASVSTAPSDAVMAGRELDLAFRAKTWAGEVAAVALGIEGALDGETEDPPATAARPPGGREARPAFDEGAVVYRETWLRRFRYPEDAETVRRFGDLVLSLAIEAGVMETGKSTGIASELAAVGADVARIESYLRQVVEEVEGSEVSTAEAALAERAGDWIVDAADLAHEIACAVEESEDRKGGAS